MKKIWWSVKHTLGVPAHSPSWREQLAAILTAFTGIATIAVISTLATPATYQNPALITSIGATAVLIFAVPHGALSQPWAVLGGHTFSAIIGITITHLFGGGILPAALAVALAIGSMNLCKCLHPPGGATALAAVLAVHDQQPTHWSFLFNPVLLNVVPIIVTAYVLNIPFSWRRYPASIQHHHHAVRPVGTAQLEQEMPFTEQQLANALQDIDAMIDISDDQMQDLYRALARQQENTHILESNLRPGAYYSNGQSGDLWAIRQIIDASEKTARKQQVIFKTIAGANKGEIRVMPRQQFSAWARYEVTAGDERWQRV